MTRNRASILILIAIGLIATAPRARAHGINLFATVQGTTIEGTLVYADGTPAPGATITAFAPDGSSIGEATTDQTGRFTFQARYRCRHRLVGDVGQGHRGLFTIPEDELPDSLPAPGSAPSSEVKSVGDTRTHTSSAEELPVAEDFDARVEAAVARQLRPLREQLNRYETSIRIRDVMGGIGYLFGLAGMLALLKTRKNRPGN